MALAPARDLAGVDAVQVLYGVIAVFTTLKINQTMSIQLESAAADQLEACEALATGIIELQRQELLDNSLATYEGGDYRATVKANSLKLLEGSSPLPGRRLLTYLVEIELKTTRALRGDEGRPIVQVRTPGRPVGSDTPGGYRDRCRCVAEFGSVQKPMPTKATLVFDPNRRPEQLEFVLARTVILHESGDRVWVVIDEVQAERFAQQGILVQFHPAADLDRDARDRLRSTRG